MSSLEVPSAQEAVHVSAAPAAPTVFFLTYCYNIYGIQPHGFLLNIINGVPTYIGPLSFVLMVTAIKDILEDIARASADKEENGRTTQVFNAQAKGFVETKWSDVRTGDIVRLVTP